MDLKNAFALAVDTAKDSREQMLTGMDRMRQLAGQPAVSPTPVRTGEYMHRAGKNRTEEASFMVPDQASELPTENQSFSLI